MQENMRPITSQNINSLYADMEGMPQQYVNHYLLSGNPMQKLVAGMIKDQRATVKPQTQAPTQTVLDQKAQTVEPGVAALPLRDGMFSEETYANGGIVAFSEGGDVPRYNGEETSWVQRNIGAPISELGGRVTSWQEKQKRLADLKQQKQYLSMGLGVGPGVGVFTKESPEARQAREAQLADITQQIENLSSAKEITPSAYGERENLMVPEGSFGSPTANVPPPPPPPAPSGPPAGAPAGPSVGGYGSTARRDLMAGYAQAEKGLEGIANYQGKYAPEEKAGLGMLRERAQKPAITEEESLAKAAKLYEGEPNAEYKAYLEGKVKGIEGDKTKAGWAAAMMAGLGMASGKSQYALTNIAEGATKGADYYLDKINKIDTANEQYQKGLADLAQAKRLEQRDMRKEANAVYQRGQERMEDAQDKYVGTIGKMNDSDKQIVKDVKVAQANLGAKKGEGLANIAMDSAKLAQSAAQHAQTIGMYEKRMNAAVGQQRAAMLKNYATISKNINDNPEYQAAVSQIMAKYKDRPNDFQREADLGNLKKSFFARELEMMGESQSQIPSAADLLD